MPAYFVIRSAMNPDEKRWILSEIKDGKVREGWFAYQGASLVDKIGSPVSEDIWIRTFQNLARKYRWNPSNKEQKKWVTEKFAQQKFRSLSSMLNIVAGDRIIVPKLDQDGGEDGFVLATAVSAPGNGSFSNGCYGFDVKNQIPKGNYDGYRHMVYVDPASVRVISREASEVSRKISHGLGALSSPVVCSRKVELNTDIERIFRNHVLSVELDTEKTEREKINDDIKRRRGQPAFRQGLLSAYKNRCAISGYDAEPALEAAHIKTFKDADLHDVTNGLLLRGDLHTLFDLHFISIRTSDWTVVVANSLVRTTYRKLDGKKVHLPIDKKDWPKQEYLNEHYKEYRSKFKD